VPADNGASVASSRRLQRSSSGTTAPISVGEPDQESLTAAFERRFLLAEAVLVSPMTRALQTALLAMDGHAAVVASGLTCVCVIRCICVRVIRCICVSVSFSLSLGLVVDPRPHRTSTVGSIAQGAPHSNARVGINPTGVLLCLLRVVGW
jgi:hypothetical protein